MALENKNGSETKRIKVLIADDHTILRQGLQRLLATSPNIDVVGEVENGNDAVSHVKVNQIDVLIMDISMPGLNGLEATRLVHKHSPNTKVLILTMHDNEEYLDQIIEAGALGYLLKDVSAQELITAIEAVNRGDSYFSPTISRKLIDGYLRAKQRPSEDGFDSLTKREQEILKLLSEAKSNREIAHALCISVKTVETHRANIMKKLNLHTLTDLVKYAIRKGFTKP
ncbi:MAG: response regulator transcription factor [Acidobacteriota bacterium]